MARIRRSKTRVCLASASLLALAACADGFDVDMRDLSGGLDTTEATRLATEPRPQPDSRGVITYPNFQVALAERGDTISGITPRQCCWHGRSATATAALTQHAQTQAQHDNLTRTAQVSGLNPVHAQAQL